MSRTIAFGLLLLAPLVGEGNANGQEEAIAAPKTYELMLNGDSFLIEADQQVRVESKEKPGTSYMLALRVAPQQPLELNTLRLDYDWPAKIQDDHGRVQRTVRIRPELGYTFLITDLGSPLASEDQEQALTRLIESVSKSLGDAGMQKLEVPKPHRRDFTGCKGQGVLIRYRDKEGFSQNCLVYLLAGEKFAATCVVQYFEDNRDNVLPRLKAMLDSIRAVR
jgi:hypothetical protein